MFVAEGVLMYLSKQQFKQLFDKLTETFFDWEFAFDSISPLMLKIQKRPIKYMSANFDWSISDIREIPQWNSGCRVIEIITFASLEAKFRQRFSINLISRSLFKYIPPFRNTYRLTSFQLA